MRIEELHNINYLSIHGIIIFYWEKTCRVNKGNWVFIETWSNFYQCIIYFKMGHALNY